MKKLPVVAVCAVSLIGPFHTVSIGCAEELPKEPAPFQFPHENQDIAAALSILASNIGISIKIDEAIKGRIYGRTQPGETAQSFLDKICREFNLVWFFDGEMLYVIPSDKVGSEVFSFEQNDAAAIIETLKQLHLYEPRFTHRFDPRSRILLVRGPPPYLKIIKQTVEALERVEPLKTTVLRGTKDMPIPLAPSNIPEADLSQATQK